MRTIKFRKWTKNTEGKYRMKQCSAEDLSSENFILACDGELMQYTGLKDKNGVEIYEGDIVLMFQPDIPQWKMKADRKILEVKWGDEYANFYLQRIDKEDENNPGGRWTAQLVKDMELVGNIYENPELLK